VTISDDPIGRAEYVQVTVPPLSVTALHRVVLPYVNVTVPVGWNLKNCDGVTVAVKVTACPKLDGLGEEVSAVVVDPMLVFNEHAHRAFTGVKTVTLVFTPVRNN
jgi:hypothetical protein